MASSGKKGKKNKGTVISLQSFLSNGDTPAGTTQVAKKIRNVDGEDSDDGSSLVPMVVQLPNAPRANRVFDDDSIPHTGPFIAYITNLPFDAGEEDIYEFFGPESVVSLRLPREDGETGRVRGFGYVEFGMRDELIHMLSLPDPTIKGRRIRIELSNENEQQGGRPRGNRRGFDGFGNTGENRDSTNWRRDNQSNRDSGGGNYERGSNRDRDRDRERKPVTDDSGGPGSWRTGSRPTNLSPRRDAPRGSGNMRSRNFDREDRDRNNDNEPIQERPKLNLKPRTLPLPEIVALPDDEPQSKIIEEEPNTSKAAKSGISAEKVFGSAKPVDTAARELEIEERLAETRRQEKLRREQDQTEVEEKLVDLHLEKTAKENTNSAISWRRRNDPEPGQRGDASKYSPDRIGSSRHDDRRRDNRDRDFNRHKQRDRNERSDANKPRPSQNRDGNREGRHRDDNKAKRESKPERPLPKYQPNQSGPVLQSSNKYSGLDDEAED